jgi:DNA-binding MarR family transcriptional regulator
MYFSCMSQASNQRDDPISLVEQEFGKFVVNLERAKNRTDSRIDRIALMVLGTLDHRGPSRLTTIADCVGFDPSTMSRQVADLEKAGLLERTTDPDDRRAALLEVTADGEALMKRLYTGRRRRLERLLSEWSDSDIATLGRVLAMLNESTAKYADQNALEFEQELNNG